MASEDEVRRKAAKEIALRSMALFVLLERAGGHVTFTDEEYEAALERVGGSANAAIHIEIVSQGGQEKAELTLVRKPPTNAELVS